jgi:hypothetical protein
MIIDKISKKEEEKTKEENRKQITWKLYVLEATVRTVVDLLKPSGNYMHQLL